LRERPFHAPETVHVSLHTFTVHALCLKWDSAHAHVDVPCMSDMIYGLLSQGRFNSVSCQYCCKKLERLWGEERGCVLAELPMQSIFVTGMVRRMRHSYALNTPRWFSALNIVGPLFPTQSCWLHCSCGLISYQKAPMARPMCVKSECRDSRVITSATWRSYHLNAPPWPMQTLKLVEYSCAKCAGCKTACSQL
jgi:hypothetical protein